MAPFLTKHLPLITNRVQFEPAIQPSPPPEITNRREFDIDAGITKASSSQDESGQTSADSDSDLDSDSESITSSLSSLSSLDGDTKIPKPPGEAGRRSRGGYDLETVLLGRGWTSKDFDAMKVT
jgi:hypothetical protein